MGWSSLRFTSDVSKPTTNFFTTISYRFNKRWWGKGFATEAITYEGNLGSIGVILKLGMHFTNKFKYTADKLLDSDTTHVDEGEIWDGFDARYTLTKKEWQGHRTNK